MSVILQLINKALFHSSLLERILGAVSDYEEGKIGEQDAKLELELIEEESKRIQKEHWDIVNSSIPE